MTSLTMTLTIPDAAFFRFIVKVVARAYCYGALSQRDAMKVAGFVAEHYPWYIE